MNKIIALDIGDVSLYRCVDKCFDYFRASDNPTLKAEILEAVDKFELGKISFEDWLGQISRITAGSLSHDEICHGWNLMIGSDMQGMEEFVREMVNAGFKFVFFSDTSELHFGDICRKLSFAHLITGSILSYEAGAKKPDAGMYQAFEDEYGIPCCYLDDMPQNIAAGRERGWFSILFTDTESMKKEFFSQINI